MKGFQIAPHETFELQELLTFKNICATKTGVMSKLVSDADLKHLMASDFSLDQQHIQELQNLIKLSVLANPGQIDSPFYQIPGVH